MRKACHIWHRAEAQAKGIGSCGMTRLLELERVKTLLEAKATETALGAGLRQLREVLKRW